MKTSVGFVILSTLAALLLSCQSGGAAQKQGSLPAWVTSQKKDPTYFYVVGYVEDAQSLEAVKQKAFENAKGKLMSYIFESATVQKSFETSGDLNSDQALRKQYSESIQTKSAANLSGVTAEEYYTEEEGGVYRVYVLSKMTHTDIEKERNRIQAEIKRKLELVDKNIREARAFVSSGAIIDAVRSYLSAAVSSTKVEDRQEEFLIYVNEAGKLLANLSIESLPGNPKVLDTGKGTNFQFRVFYASSGGKQPVSGAKITFVVRNNSGSDYTRSAVSDQDGLVTCNVGGLKEVRGDNRLEAKLSFDLPEMLSLPENYRNSYSVMKDYTEKIYTAIEFKTQSAENRAITTVVVAMAGDGTGTGYKSLPAMAGKVREQLISKGYKVVTFDNSVSLVDLNDAAQPALTALGKKGIKQLAVVTVESLPDPVQNPNLGNQFGATYQFTFRLFDTETGEEKASASKRLSINTSSAAANLPGFFEQAARKIKEVLP